MLSGLMSRWRTRLEWQKARAAATWPRTDPAAGLRHGAVRLEHVQEALSGAVLHDDVRVKVVLDAIQELDDPVMLAGQGLHDSHLLARLHAQAPPHMGPVQDLAGHLPPGLPVYARVHAPESALAQELPELVPGLELSTGPECSGRGGPSLCRHRRSGHGHGGMGPSKAAPA